MARFDDLPINLVENLLLNEIASLNACYPSNSYESKKIAKQIEYYPNREAKITFVKYWEDIIYRCFLDIPKKLWNDKNFIMTAGNGNSSKIYFRRSK